MKFSCAIAIALTIALSGCGSSKETSSAEQPSTTSNPAADNTAPAGNSGSVTGTATTTSTQNQMTENSQAQEKQAEVKYRLILSFISIGEGTDATARQTMDGILQKWESKSGKKISMESYPWGREGEVDFCFLLKELSPEDQAALAREMREAFQQRPLVQIFEYQESMHKR